MPIRWFVLFRDEERRLTTDEAGGTRLHYRTTTRRAIRRAEQAVVPLRRSDLGPISDLIVDLHQWMHAFDPSSLLELDYGDLSALLTWDELDEDHSARDVHEALEALEREEYPTSRRRLPGRVEPVGRGRQPRSDELTATVIAVPPMVARGRIELPTPRFSAACSTY